MQAIIDKIRHYAIRAALGAAAVAIAVALLLTWMWRDRPVLDAVDWQEPLTAAPRPGDVTLTWLGVSTLLFDDGDTQILIDGFLSRPTFPDLVLGREIDNNIPLINRVLLDYRMQRLAAIIPVHSHYDHAMDVGAIANRSSASILGSESTANFARGAGVPEDQLLVVAPGEEYTFGEFRVTLFEAPHAPIGWRGATPLAGVIDEPFDTPAPISAWREGQSYSIVVAHPQGTAIVQGSAGFATDSLSNVQADVVFLGVGLLQSLGRDYAERYWQALVTTTGATRVFPVHFDDMTNAFGDIRLPPKFLDDFPETAEWLAEFRATWDTDVTLHLPVFGEPLALYSVVSAPSS